MLKGYAFANRPVILGYLVVFIGVTTRRNGFITAEITWYDENLAGPEPFGVTYLVTICAIDNRPKC
jgi:hypothetical protein